MLEDLQAFIVSQLNCLGGPIYPLVSFSSMGYCFELVLTSRTHIAEDETLWFHSTVFEFPAPTIFAGATGKGTSQVQCSGAESGEAMIDSDQICALLLIRLGLILLACQVVK